MYMQLRYRWGRFIRSVGSGACTEVDTLCDSAYWPLDLLFAHVGGSGGVIRPATSKKQN